MAHSIAPLALAPSWHGIEGITEARIAAAQTHAQALSALVIREAVQKARDARTRARNFAAIGHAGLARGWRNAADEYMGRARRAQALAERFRME